MLKSGSDRKFANYMIKGLFISLVFDIIVLTTTGMSVAEKYFFVFSYTLYLIIMTLYIQPYMYIEKMRDGKCKIKPTYKKYNLRYPVYYVGNNRLFARKVCNLYKTLDETDRADFERKGFYIVLGTHSDFKVENKEVGGYFFLRHRKIVLFTDEYICFSNNFKDVTQYVEIEKSDYSLKTTFYHEWGHFVDFKHHYTSYTKEFLKYYYSKKSEYVHDSVGFGRLNSPKSEFGRVCSIIRKWKEPYIYEFTTPRELYAVEYSRYKLGAMLYKELRPFFEGH